MSAHREHSFTPAQAQAALRAHLATLRDAQTAQRAHDAAVHQLRTHVVTDPRTRTRLAQRAEQLRDAVRIHLDDLADAGLVVRSLTPHLLVDLPAHRDGAPVWLCWHEEDPSLAHWHPLHAGRAERAPIDATGSARWRATP